MRQARLGAFLAAIAVVSAVALAPQAAERNRAGVVVRSPGGEVKEMCVFFDEPEITGAELLERADLTVITEAGALGTAVCSIDGIGCKRGDCFCEYPSFWGYWTRDDQKDGWGFSDVGAADRVVTDGSMDGWSFGEDGKPPPPERVIDDVCATSAQATSAARPSATPSGASPPSYAAFAGFVALLTVGASLAYAVRRRPRRP